MRILVVDDVEILLNNMVKMIKEIKTSDLVIGYSSPIEALEDAKKSKEPIFAAFLDIEMYGMNGLELAYSLKKLFPSIHIVFVTAYSEYAVKAFELKVSGYLLKPVSKDKLVEEFSAMNTQYVVTPKKRIYAQTFGNFDLFVDGKPVHFSRSKSKELLAFLIDRRGATSTMAELASVLFNEETDDKQQKQYLRTAIASLKVNLAGVNATNILVKEHNSIAINPQEMDCDYFQLLSGNVAVINSFLGEYMTNYSWAEFTVATLCDKCLNNNND